MASLYRRGNVWWWKCSRNGKMIRETTRTGVKEEAILFMNRRLAEIDGSNVPKAPRILILDIETAPMEYFTWTCYPNYLDPIKNEIKPWSILSWAARWLFEKDIHSEVVTPMEAEMRDDGSILRPLWDLFEEANVIVAHNGDQFDIRKCNWRFAVNGLGPPSPYQTIDTKKVAKKVFGAASNKQDYLNRAFGLKRKIETDYELWVRCVNGDWDALQEMQKYNKGDIMGLEELYMKLVPWIKGPVNLAMYQDCDRMQCPNCLGFDLKALSQPYVTPAGQYDSFRCLRCGTIGRSRYTNLTLQQRKNSILSTAR